ncbi:MAG: hypothetical protein IH886_00370, partial [Nitrospinae bacterium]|nr:hypothetical protein [Nitrospinota bacterium]
NPSNADDIPREQSTAKPEGQDSPASPEISRESGEERQPDENVSRLHEMVIDKPAPFDPGPPEE